MASVSSSNAMFGTANVAAQELQHWNGCQLPWSKVVLNKDCVMQTFADAKL